MIEDFRIIPDIYVDFGHYFKTATMKKSILLYVLLAASQILPAQKELPKGKIKKDTIKPKMMVQTKPVQVSATIVQAPSIRVYERPNYQGRSAQFIKNAENKFEFPFPLQHVSFQVPDGMIVYIKSCFEFATENAYTRSQPDINLEGICGIRTDYATLVNVMFAGISTEVHNLDCMRFGGRIDIKMMETAPGDYPMEVLMPFKEYTFRDRIDAYTYTPFNWDKSQLTNNRYSPLYNNTGTIFNNNPVPELTKQARDYFGNTQASGKNAFYVGRTALSEGRVKIWVRTDITSSHKTCDLCDDFSSQIKLATPGIASIPLNKPYGDGKILDAAHPYLVLGPYTATGSRDGVALTATSGTIKHFRVHLKVYE